MKPHNLSPPISEPDFWSQYLETARLIERLHRALLDVITDELHQHGRADITATQALILFNFGDDEISAGDLRKRGIYLATNVSYNIKKLVGTGFLDHARSTVDRRQVRIKITSKGRAVRDIVQGAFAQQVATIERVGGSILKEQFAGMNAALLGLERFWAMHIRVGARP